MYDISCVQPTICRNQRFPYAGVCVEVNQTGDAIVGHVYFHAFEDRKAQGFDEVRVITAGVFKRVFNCVCQV